MNPVLIFGAGRTGRGFAAHACARAGVPFALIDRDRALIAALRDAASFRVEVLGREEVVRLEPAFVAHVDDDWQDAFDAAGLAFTAVFGNNLGALGGTLARALTRRHARHPRRPLDIITLENLAHAAATLRAATIGALDATVADAVAARTGFVEGIVLKTCLAPRADVAGRDPLRVLAQDLFRIPCDADAFVGPRRPLPDLDPLPRFGHQLVRKIYTYNGINAVISYVGAARGHRELSAATADPAILALARRAGAEAGHGLIGAYGFAGAEQRAWTDQAIAKFADPAIPDPIARNAADPERKLQRDDRLVGPALLALEHGVEPTAFASAIVAAMGYRDAGAPSQLERLGSIDAVLSRVCGLAIDGPLAALVRAAARDEAPSRG
ncbi:MAG TPA: hypothetical protein VEL07_19620 [Planctomycetota bacterium]|nr:hypothetical protein [Planctomycetota bacterium]